jgi:hypothetical protein
MVLGLQFKGVKLIIVTGPGQELLPLVNYLEGLKERDPEAYRREKQRVVESADLIYRNIMSVNYDASEEGEPQYTRTRSMEPADAVHMALLELSSLDAADATKFGPVPAQLWQGAEEALIRRLGLNLAIELPGRTAQPVLRVLPNFS